MFSDAPKLDESHYPWVNPTKYFAGFVSENTMGCVGKYDATAIFSSNKKGRNWLKISSSLWKMIFHNWGEQVTTSDIAISHIHSSLDTSRFVDASIPIFDGLCLCSYNVSKAKTDPPSPILPFLWEVWSINPYGWFYCCCKLTLHSFIYSAILVGGIPTPLKNMSSSVGMIIPYMKWKIKAMFQTTNRIKMDSAVFPEVWSSGLPFHKRWWSHSTAPHSAEASLKATQREAGHSARLNLQRSGKWWWNAITHVQWTDSTEKSAGNHGLYGFCYWICRFPAKASHHPIIRRKCGNEDLSQ